MRHQTATDPTPIAPAPEATLATTAGKTFRRETVLRKGILALAAALALSVGVGVGGAATGGKSADSLSGAGATFPFPLISQWIPKYDSLTGVRVDYSPVGSGGGIAAITNRTVDFGASDAPMTADQLRACNGCVQIPWVLSATAVAYNVPNAPVHLKMTGSLLANIYLGKVDKWNDRAIRRINPGVNLPDLKITPIFRSDSSGTSFNFTDYLSKVSAEWKSKVGRGTQVNFPAGVGGRGSSGVSAVLSRTSGGIMYADVAYSLASHFKFFRMQNRAGKFQLPGLRGIKAAASSIKSTKQIPADNELSIVNPAKSNKLAYPICTFSYVILPLKTEKAPVLRKFVFWALTGGQKYGPKLLFQPIPTPVLVRAEQTLRRVHS
jgi:phosphate transport system substrate-binding protein